MTDTHHEVFTSITERMRRLNKMLTDSIPSLDRSMEKVEITRSLREIATNLDIIDANITSLLDNK